MEGITAITSTNVPEQPPPPPNILFTLPAELRNYMYEMVLQDYLSDTITRTGPSAFKFPPLQQVSHQIRQEAGSVLYYGRIFYFNDPKDLVVSF
jgi:hypothetical protein